MKSFIAAVMLSAFIVGLFSAAAKDTVACENRYAILICGDTPYSAYQAYVEGRGHWKGTPVEHKGVFYYSEFWDDVNRMYDILIENADFSPEEIFVLWGNGQDWTEIHPELVCCRYFPHHGPVTDFAATLDNVRMVLNGLRTGDPENGIPQMTENDCLFLYTFDHGNTGPEPDGDQWGDALLCLMDGEMTDTEFSDSLNAIPYEKRAIFMQQCFSGGFIDNLTSPPHDLKTSISTACRGDEGAWPADDISPFPDPTENEICPYCEIWVIHGEFNYYFMSAFQWYSTWVPPTPVDANLEPPDFYISSYEAAQWEMSHQSTWESPQYKDEGMIGHSWIFTSDTASSPYEGPIWYVSKSGDDLTGNGDSLHPFATIQKGISMADSGDTVLVESGTYVENINFFGKAITVASHFIYNRSSATIDATIIDGSSPVNPDSASVVTFVSGEDTNSVLKGFTITGGTGTAYDGPGMALRQAGGIYCFDSSPAIINNLIIENHIPGEPGGERWEMGGGIGCRGASSPLIANNLILNNSCWDGGSGISLYNVYYDGSLIIANNTISNNGGAGVGDGICVCDHDGSLHIRNNIIVNNDGAGIVFVYDPYPSYLTYNDVWNNAYGDFIGCPSGVGQNDTVNCNSDSCDSFFNISMDPLFDPDSTNYFLLCSSPCIDAGDPSDPVPPEGGRYVDMGAVEYPYVCGDADGDGKHDIGDVIFKINYLFIDGPLPCPMGAADDDRNCIVDVGDIMYEINYLFLGGSPPVCGGE